MTNWARIERHRLCDLFDEVGPDAPTLCGDWRTRDLAAHLILRESRPDAVPGVLSQLGPLRRHTESVQRKLADPALDWTATVERIRQGPPRWSPMRIQAVDRLANTVEFFVHHEDVRRGGNRAANADGAEPTPTAPRQLEADLTRTLTAALRRFGALLRRTPAALELRLPDGDVILRRKAHRSGRSGETAPPTTDGGGTVVVRGQAGELVLFAYGRQAVAAVTMTGDDSQIAAMRLAPLGI
ncbi:MAG: TIGR03085 family metal-binding protein [Acidimicrobiales bacterium]